VSEEAIIEALHEDHGLDYNAPPKPSEPTPDQGGFDVDGVIRQPPQFGDDF
jgi:hypothetical protein